MKENSSVRHVLVSAAVKPSSVKQVNESDVAEMSAKKLRSSLLRDIIETASAVGGDRGAIVEPFISEMNRFLSADVNENETAMDFWCQKAADFPILSQMAKIYLL